MRKIIFRIRIISKSRKPAIRPIIRSNCSSIANCPSSFFRTSQYSVAITGAVRAVCEKYSDLYIIHFDAHADLRDDYLGQKLSHACVLRRCHELVGDGHIFQFGIRSGDRDEFRFAAEHTEMHKFSFDGLAETVEKLRFSDNLCFDFAKHGRPKVPMRKLSPS